MGLWDVFATLYVLVALFAVAMTYREQQQKGLRSPLFNAIGFVVCLVWPVMIAVVLHSRVRSTA